MTSPVSALQNFLPDVLSIIFEYGFWSTSAVSEKHPPLNVSATCNWWRTVALSTPTLWTRIYVEYGRFREEPNQHILQAFIARSRGLPLSIVLRCHIRTDPLLLRDGLIAHLLLGCRDRWESIYIRSIYHDVCQMFLHRNTAPASRLRALAISDPLAMSTDSVTLSVDAFPSLESMALYGPMLVVREPYRTLRSLMLEIIWASSLCEELQCLPHLEKLELKFHSGGRILPGPQVQLPFLRSLRLGGFCPPLETGQTSFFSMLIMPNLTQLRVGFINPPLFMILRNVLEICTVSNTALRSLEIPIQIPMEQVGRMVLLGIFRLNPRLQSFTTSPLLLDKQMVEVLVLHDDREHLLPSLEVLKLKGEEAEASSEYKDSLREMTLSRGASERMTVRWQN